MDDARLNEWAAAHRDGDDEALRLLVEALTRPLVAMAFRYVGDWESARDLTQDSWVRVHGSLERWDDSRPVRPRIFAIHRNLCLDRLRRQSQIEMLGEAALEQIEDRGSNPWTQLTHGELVARIHRALSRLSDVQRRIFTMVDLEEMRPADRARSNSA